MYLSTNVFFYLSQGFDLSDQTFLWLIIYYLTFYVATRLIHIHFLSKEDLWSLSQSCGHCRGATYELLSTLRLQIRAICLSRFIWNLNLVIISALLFLPTQQIVTVVSWLFTVPDSCTVCTFVIMPYINQSVSLNCTLNYLFCTEFSM